MKTSKMAVALAFASVVGTTPVTLALSKDHDDRGEHRDKGWHKGQSRGYHDEPRYRPVRHEEPYHYAQPVYVPPAVYYPPQPSLGISLFFPIDLR